MPEQDMNVPVPTPDGQPRFTQRLFSEEVGIARASSDQDVIPRDIAYEWSNGRRFVQPNGN